MLLRLLLIVVLLPPCANAAGAGDTATRRIAITLDDAPTTDGALFSGTQRTAAIIAALAAAAAPPVALFVTTGHITGDGARDRLRAYTDAGHLLGNHSHRHGWLSRMGVEEWEADLDQAVGILAGLPNTRPWYRHPFLDEGRQPAQRDAARAALQVRGMVNGYVTVDTYDWYLASRVDAAARSGSRIDHAALRRLYLDMLLASVAFYDRIATQALGRSPVHVLLLHENDLAALYLGDLVRALRADGWTVVSPDVAYADPIAARLPDTTFQGQGRVAALAHDAGTPRPQLVHASEDERWIDAEIARRQVLATAR